MKGRASYGLLQALILIGLLLVAAALVRDNLGYPNR